MSDPPIQKVEFAGTKVALVLEQQVRRHLDLDLAMADLKAGFVALSEQRAFNQPRTRIDWRGSRETRSRSSPRLAWLHTLRAGLAEPGIVGGKDYSSLGFDIPAMWVTVVDAKTGKPVAFIEAEYLSRVRTAATAAIATELLSPTDVTTLAHFGAGKISELLVRAVLEIRPSIRRVFLVRRSFEKGPPEWLSTLGDGIAGTLTEARNALAMAEIVTTATSSSTPVIPDDTEHPHLRHINLIGANHWKRREIGDKLARRCLQARGGYLVVEDIEQAQNEAGDFRSLVENVELDWSTVATLSQLFVDERREKTKSASAQLTAFKSVGTGLMDLAVAGGLLQRMGLLPPPADTA